jgi:hypothetical protein
LASLFLLEQLPQRVLVFIFEPLRRRNVLICVAATVCTMLVLVGA